MVSYHPFFCFIWPICLSHFLCLSTLRKVSLEISERKQFRNIFPDLKIWQCTAQVWEESWKDCRGCIPKCFTCQSFQKTRIKMRLKKPSWEDLFHLCLCVNVLERELKDNYLHLQWVGIHFMAQNVTYKRYQNHWNSIVCLLKQSHNIGKQYCPKAHTLCITTYIENNKPVKILAQSVIGVEGK
jgi:hypothetical protein